MPTIKELFDECIQNDYLFIAHTLYYLLLEGLVSPDSRHTILDQVEFDVDLVGEWTKQNYLRIQIEKVYSLKISDDEFVFVFARDAQTATAYIKNNWKIHARNCHEYSLDFTIIRGEECISFRNMKKDFLSFPAVIGLYEREAFILE